MPDPDFHRNIEIEEAETSRLQAPRRGLSKFGFGLVVAIGAGIVCSLVYVVWANRPPTADSSDTTTDEELLPPSSQQVQLAPTPPSPPPVVKAPPPPPPPQPTGRGIDPEAAAAEQRRLAEDQARRAEAERLAREAEAEAKKWDRFRSPMVVKEIGAGPDAALVPALGDGKKKPEDAAKSAGTFQSSNMNDQFLALMSDSSVTVSKAEKTPRLDALIAQGTILHGVLETAVISDLPGMVRALTTENVWSYDGRRVAGFTPQIDYIAASKTAQNFEEQSIVLLKNSTSQAPLDGSTNLLPLNASKLTNIAVIGSHADDAVLSGGGSGEVRNPVWGQYTTCGNVQFGYWGTGCEWWSVPWKYAAQATYPANPANPRLSIVAAIQAAAPKATVTYGGHSDHNDPFRSYTTAEIADAVAKAQAANVAIVVVNQITGEDTDLNSLSLSNYKWNGAPNNQEAMIAAVAAVNKNTIVVIESANPVLMPWLNNVSAVVDAWYPGEAGGPALANVLFGVVNPSGKLPITFPNADNVTPTGGGTFPEYPNYTEGLLVGYRWYDANDPTGATVLFPFGFGLSYTTYSYANLKVSAAGDGAKTVTFDVTNTGAVAGQEVAEVYIAHPVDVGEPPKRLAGWQKVALAPNQTQTVSVTISPQTQSIYDVTKPGWQMVEPVNIMVGGSSRSLPLKLH